MLSDAFTVIRNSYATDTTGRARVTGTERFDTWGIVTSRGSPLVAEPDKQYSPNTIDIATQFRLRGPGGEFQPDIIYWRGDYYKVTNLQDYSMFGNGFVTAAAESVDYNDAPPSGEDRP